MALSLGSSLATKVYLGATEINLAYFGATQVYSSTAFSAEAQNYFGRLDAAGDTTYVDYKQPLANYIDGLVTLGGAYWDTMESAACFVGVGIQGVEVPLRSGMPTLTNNNFLVGDLDQLTGLIGNGIDKDISTGVAESQMGQNDSSFSVYASTRENTTARIIGSGARNYIAGKPATGYYANVNDSSFPVLGTGTAVPNFVGVSRSSATEITWLGYGQSGTILETSTWTPTTGVFTVFSQAGSTYSTARLATYHVGPAINLATLGALQDTLITEIAEAQFSAEAANYFARLTVAGDSAHYAYRQPLANYIDGLVALGGAYWDNMVSAASFVGVGIQGITVPLRAGMAVATNNNFVDTDLDQLIGLKGDASTKYITTGVVGGDLLLDDNSLSVYLTEGRETGGGRYISGEAARYTMLGNATGARARSVSNNIQTLGASTALNKLIGISRNNSADFDWRYETSGTITDASFLLSNVNINVFADSSGANKVAARLATYHIGPALNLATLEALQATLLSEVVAAKAAAAAENYFSRLAAAGDTTHVAYKQPLTNYISSLVALGGAYWDDMVSACSFVGVGIQGITVPLRAGMAVATNNNLVAGDLDQLTGLKGDGSTKYINANVTDSDTSQDDVSMSCWVSTGTVVNNAVFMGTTRTGMQSTTADFAPKIKSRSTSSNQVNVSPTLVRNFFGHTRTNSTDFDYSINGASGTATRTSIASVAEDVGLFNTGSPTGVYSDSRLATYHYGPALNLATLEALQDTLITEIAAI